MKHFLQRMMVFGAAVMLCATISADDFQLPDSKFEDWSGEKFDSQEQNKYWHASNVQQTAMGMTLKFNFAHKETGRSGYCLMAQDQKVGVSGLVEETSPSYYSLGYAWAYLEGLNTSSATAGTYGGYAFAHRPDTVSVWIKRTGSNWDKEDFHVLFYSWSGTAKGASYRNKSGECTTVAKEDEESDIRVALDGNTCQITTPGNQIAEAWVHDRKQYTNWVNLRIPVYYLKSDAPTKCNLIFSASNYPNYRANSGLYEGNSLYVDDLELIYASTIQKLFINDKEWTDFNPNTSEVQYYELSENATDVPSIEARRGAGELTNVPKQSTTKTQKFPGRVLSGSEISIVKGDLENTPTVITVKSEDGKSTSTYRIQFRKAAGSNAKLASIAVNGTPIAGFAPTKFNYTVDLPYGTTTIPVVTAEKQEEEQTVVIKQATSVEGTATITVTAANGTTKETYNVTFKVGKLADNTLKDILVNGKSIPGFTPTQAVYKVSLPVGTTQMPTVEAVSAYPAGEQTIVYEAPAEIDGGQYKISVSTPGNTVAKVYKLNFKLEASSYTYLADLQVVGDQVAKVEPAKEDDQTAILFTPNNLTYKVFLKMGASTLPQINYTKGDEYQTVVVNEGGLEGITRITVTAGNGDQAVYKLNFTALKSDNSKLADIKIGGKSLEGFSPDVTLYTVNLPIGTTTLPEIEPIKGDEFQNVVLTTAGVNGTTRITVTAGDGSTTIYQIKFAVATFTDNTLKSLSVGGGYHLQDADYTDIDFDPQRNEYWVKLKSDETKLPTVTAELQNPQYQDTTVTRPTSLNGNYKITVYPTNGASRTYVIHFVFKQSDNTALKMIYINDTVKNTVIELPGFDPEQINYTHELDTGAVLPVVTWDLAEESQTAEAKWDGKTVKIHVQAQNGTKRIYKIKFVIPSAASTQLKGINVGGEPLEGFRPDQVEYTYDLTTETCPAIEVEKGAEEQIVTITAPYAAGIATINVRFEDAETNYTIDFVPVAPESARLKGILVDGVALDPFDPTTMDYTYEYEGALPVVQAIKENDEQQVQVLWKDNVASLHVQDAQGNKAVYSVTFIYKPSANTALEGIYADGSLIEGFNAAELNYTYHLGAGSTYPTITYKAAESKQVVFFGQTGDGQWSVRVVAENGSEAIYTVQYIIDKYDDATLKNLAVEGYSLNETFDPAVNNYSVTIDNGAALPAIIVEAREGQTVLKKNVGDNEQQVVVVAESGRTNTYFITYTRKTSSNALLADILVGGVSLKGFAPETYNYVDSLDREDEDGNIISITEIPNVFPIGQLPNQTITTYFSRPNGVTRIHVEAQDGETTADYYIAFPVRMSSNNRLKSVDLITEYEDVFMSFQPAKTKYEVLVPFEATVCPQLSIVKGEDEQRVDIISRPIGDTTQVIVYAANGESRTYNFLFRREPIGTRNQLAMIRIAETDKELSLRDRTQRVFDVNMPYASRSLTVEYEKLYNEQTVFIQPGGVTDTTYITVKAHNDSIPDEVYKLNPIVETQDPAVLASLTVNGEPVEGFDKNRFSYIVRVNSTEVEAPVVVAEGLNNAMVTPAITNTKHWQGIVSKNGQMNTYDIWFYYPGDVVPNADFTNWATATNNDAPKPAGWNCIADYFHHFDGPLSGTHTFGKNGEVTEVTVSGSNKGVQLESKKSDGNFYSSVYGGALGGILPAWITLGSIEGLLQTAGGSSFRAVGGITFRNTPDVMLVNAKTGDVNGKGDNSTHHNRIVYQLSGIGSGNMEFTTKANTGYQEYAFNLADVNKFVTAPTQLNIILNSFFQESMTNLDYGTAASLSVDYIHFTYNHKLASLKVDDIELTPSASDAFMATLTDPERVEIPVLKFAGEVDDQAQKVTWSEPDKTSDENFEIRTATIRNWAENGTDYTDYSLTVKRPFDTRNELANLLLDGAQIEGFGTKTDFEIRVQATNKHLMDIVPVPASSLQKVTTAFDKEASKMTITVTPEKGEAKVYTITFIVDWSDDTTLASIMVGDESIDVTERNHEVTAVNMPVITFTKKSDLQVVSLINGVITVKAENGDEGTYQITRLNPKEEADGIIKAFSVNGTAVENFGGTTNKTHEAPQPNGAVFFTRDVPADSVIFIQSETQMEWRVLGSDGKHNEYVWTYKAEEESDNTLLANITLNGENYSEFDATTNDPIIITSDTTLIVGFVLSDDNQELTTTVTPIEGGVQYEATVTAPNGATKTYVVNVIRPKSSLFTLAGILVDGVMIDGFEPTKTNYTVKLSTPAVKIEQPQMPSITYIARHPGQQISIVKGNVNDDDTKITVQSEDGDPSNVLEYRVAVSAEPSHCSNLTGITVNGEALDHFEPGRHFYSVSLKTEEYEVDYTADDRFLKVTQLQDTIKEHHEYRDTLRVTAEDGSISDYLLEIYIENQSNDAQLADILLDNMDFISYKESIMNDPYQISNPTLKAFDPGQNNYRINVPREKVPQVSAKLKMNGQAVDIHPYADSVFLNVWAVDSTLNTYRLYFEYQKSTNSSLRVLEINNEAVANFNPYEYYYTFNLQDGEDFPTITWEVAHDSATVVMARRDNIVTLTVTAEDKSYVSTYTIAVNFKKSDIDYIEVIEENRKPLPGFSPDKYYYERTLNVGDTIFPEISYGQLEAGVDNWPQPRIDSVTLEKDELHWVHQTTVTAQNGQSRTYTISYTIPQSSIDTLQMIFINQKQLPGFNASVYEYYYRFTVEEAKEQQEKGRVLVDCLLGDNYQDTIVEWPEETVLAKSLGYKTVITVTAKTGAQRIYTIHYPVDLSSEATLEDIQLSKQIDNFSFDADRFNYPNLEIGMTEAIPAVSVVKKEEAQSVDIIVENDQVRVVVVAEDGVTSNTYTLSFVHLKSAETKLKEILLTNVEGTLLTSGEFPYRPDYYEYTVNLPYDGKLTAEEQLPTMEFVKYDDEQTVETVNHELPNSDIQADVTVTAPNGEDQAIYSITFHWLKPDDADLVAIILNGDTLEGFHPGITEYTYAHPFGSTEDDYFTLDQITYVLSDSLATATTSIREDGTVFISVVAQSGYENPYVIRQLIAEDGDNALAWITLDGDTLLGFDPDVTFYTYYLLPGKGVPSVDAMPRSENAFDPSIREASAGDTCLIICTAADQTERRYYIHFAISENDPGLEPTANDVLIKRVPGAMQLFVTSIRQGVSFALYNHTGQLVYETSLDKVADPNYTSVTHDTYDKSILVDVTSWHEGVLIDVNPNEMYIYTFFKSDSSKKIIKSGKIRCLP